MKILIKGGRVVDPKNDFDKVADVLVDNGVISEIGENINANGDVTVIEAEGKIVSPGLVDMHSHLRDPGQEYKEDIESGTRSAAMGGITSIACMPNTKPVTDSEPIVTYIKTKAKEVGHVNVYPIGSISKGLEGKELAEIGELKNAGAVAISDDGRPVVESGLMRRALEYAKMFDIAVISHCEDLGLADGGQMNEGFMATYLGLKGITRAAEEVMVSRDILIAEATHTAIHIAHVSTRGSVELVRQAKKRGVNVTCETCPHYFTLTENAVDGFNTNAKMNPPLRTSDDVEAIKEGAISAYNMIIVRNFFMELPRELEEAASIDGCSDIGIFIKIALPLSLPCLATFGLFYAVGHWNNYFGALLYLEDSTKFPFQLVLRNIVMQTAETQTDPNALIPEDTLKMAVIVIGTVPILIVYPFLQKHFAAGVMVGAVKG